MTPSAQSLAETAQRVAVAHVVRHYGGLSLVEFARITRRARAAQSPYADVLADLRVVDLLETDARLLPMAAPVERPSMLNVNEPLENSVMRVFRAHPEDRLPSSVLTRHLGVPRWTAQKVLGQLVSEGKLRRAGRTSSTRYWLASS